MEYQDLLGRPVWGDATTTDERHEVLAGLARQGRWVIVTHNFRDLRGGTLPPAQMIKTSVKRKV